MNHLDYLRIPYLHKGASTQGADCFGFVQIYYKDKLDISIPNFPENYVEDWWQEHDYFKDNYLDYGFTRVVGEPKEHDLLFIYNTNKNVGHCGIVIPDGYFIHMSKRGCVVAPYLRGIWRSRIEGFYRYAGLTDNDISHIKGLPKVH